MFENPCKVITKTTPIARKQHKCLFCYRVIEKGERYHYDYGIWEDSGCETLKYCHSCFILLSEKIDGEEDCWCYDSDEFWCRERYLFDQNYYQAIDLQKKFNDSPSSSFL